MTKANGLRLTISLLIIAIIFILPTAVKAQNAPAEDHAGQPGDRVRLTLRADGAPLPGGTAFLSIDATPMVNTPELEIHWVIPQGVQLFGTDMDTFTDTPVNQVVHSERSLSFPTEGTYKIAVSASLHLSPSVTYGASGVLFFIIDSHGSRVTDRDPDAGNMKRNGFEQITVSPASVSAGPQSPDDDPCFTIYAHFDRIERPVILAGWQTPGYGPDVRIPLVGYSVEFRESDFLFDDSYGYLNTDANGNVAGSFCDDDGWFDDTLEIYLRVEAELGDPIVYVEDSSWIDEEYEYDTGEAESDGGTINFVENMGDIWSGIFNIVDTAYQAQQFWILSGNGIDEETEIHWEDGYGDDISSYNHGWDEITIADDPTDPDQWDESVIIHEWGHFTDDHYSCDDSPPDSHSHDGIYDSELAWGEGYADYYQSPVRDYYGFPDASYYLNVNGSGVNGSAVGLEDFNITHSNLVTYENEMAVAAALWDLYDTNWDQQDQVSHGHALIQAVFTSDEFYDIAYDLFDDTCDFDTYMHGWVDYGAPTDAQTAAAIKQNTGYTLVPNSSMIESTAGTTATSNFTAAQVYRWWKQLTYVADNSFSMTGPKFEAMKTLFTEAVSDLGEDPEGTEFTLDLFNNTSSANTTEFEGQFFPDQLLTPIDNLETIGGPDTNCNVFALRALSQAVNDKEKGDAWLFTDGDTIQNPSVQSVRQLLNDNQIRASVALMGGCMSADKTQTPIQSFSTEMLEGLTAEEQQSLMAERLLPGLARAELGLMADEVPGGVVPYLLTALNSGGMFLYVSPDQLDDAADVLRAQITNSAGAGRWSDYVSDQATYRWDSLARWEYGWIDARLYGTQQGNPPENASFAINLPPSTYFQYFSGPYYNHVDVFEDGYVTLGHHAGSPNNTEIPSIANPNNALYALWDNLQPYCPPAAASSPQACMGYIYSFQDGDWFAVEYYDYVPVANQTIHNNFEILLNLETYEIRYQYKSVPNGGATATVGLENSNGTNGIQVSIDDVNGASNGTGYKFVPAPPQPTRTYTVTVDSSMDAVGFLLTGYSGDFMPLVITDRDGDPVSCDEEGAMCLNQDLVQYVQVNTNGRTGDWNAVVDAGPSGAGTYSFISFAASPIAVSGQLNHTLAIGSQQLMVQVTGDVDGCALTGQFNLVNGEAFGGSINFFDDGLHGDSRSCDGLFGSDSFAPPWAASAYLTLRGLHGGEPFVRIDPQLFSFQLLEVTSLGDGVNYGGVTYLPFSFTNHDIYDHCYWLTYSAPAGWWIDFPGPPGGCLYAGETANITYHVYMAPGTTNDLPSGTTGLLTLSATEWEKGLITDSDTARITRHRPPSRIDITSSTHHLRPNGDTAMLEITVVDEQYVRVPDGTEVLLSATMGVVSPTAATTEGGVFYADFISGADTGTAEITAILRDNKLITGTTEIEIANPLPNRIVLETSASRLPANGNSTALLVATVRDNWGDPLPGQAVQIGVEGDGQLGTISGQELVSGITDANGQFSAVFTNGGVIAVVGVRAELLYNQGAGLETVLYDRKEIMVGSMHYLPLTMR